MLQLLAEGRTDSQIAELLELSPATVQTHVRNAKAKLGARTRAQAVAVSLRRGLIGTLAPSAIFARERRWSHAETPRERAHPRSSAD